MLGPHSVAEPWADPAQSPADLMPGDGPATRRDLDHSSVVCSHLPLNALPANPPTG